MLRRQSSHRDLDLAKGIKQAVCGLQVVVDDLVLRMVQVGQATQHLCCNHASLLLRKHLDHSGIVSNAMQ